MQQFTANKMITSNTSLSQKSHNCKTSERREIILPEDYKQYSRIECAICSRWITWGRSPLVTEEYEQRKKVIDKCLKIRYGFSSWQIEFLKNISNKRYLTEKQKATYESIISLYTV